MNDPRRVPNRSAFHAYVSSGDLTGNTTRSIPRLPFFFACDCSRKRAYSTRDSCVVFVEGEFAGALRVDVGNPEVGPCGGVLDVNNGDTGN